MQLNRTPNALTRTDRENLDKNWGLIEEEINRLGPAPALAELAKLAAEQANAKTDNVQKQLNVLVVEGDSSPQAIQASVGADGTDYDGNLKARLDAEHNTVTAQLAEANNLAGQAVAKNVIINPKKTTSKVMMTIVDDDGRSEVWSRLKPISEELGVPFTVAMPVRNGETTADKELTKDQLLYLQNTMGWEIASHSWTHSNLRILTDAQLEHELGGSKKELQSWGLNIKNFVAPYGSNDEPRVRKIASKYYNCGARVGGNANTKPVQNHFLGRIAFGSATGANNTLAFYKNQVDQAIANSGWLIFMTHIWDPQHTLTQDQYLRETILYAQSLGVEIVNLQEGFEEFGNMMEVEGVSGFGNDGQLRGTKMIPTHKIDPLPFEALPAKYQIGQIGFNAITDAARGNYPASGKLYTLREINNQAMQVLIGLYGDIKIRNQKLFPSQEWDSFKQLVAVEDFDVLITVPDIPTKSAVTGASMALPKSATGKRVSVQATADMPEEWIWSTVSVASTLKIRVFNTHTATMTGRVLKFRISISDIGGSY